MYVCMYVCTYTLFELRKSQVLVLDTFFMYFYYKFVDLTASRMLILQRKTLYCSMTYMHTVHTYVATYVYVRTYVMLHIFTYV